MGKFMKPGKVVMVLAGRYAGRKAVIVKVLFVCGVCFICGSSLVMCVRGVHTSHVKGQLLKSRLF